MWMAVFWVASVLYGAWQLVRTNKALDKLGEASSHEFNLSAVQYGLPFPILFGRKKIPVLIVDAWDIDPGSIEDHGKKREPTDYPSVIPLACIVCMGPVTEVYGFEVGQDITQDAVVDTPLFVFPGTTEFGTWFQPFGLVWPSAVNIRGFQSGGFFYGTSTQGTDPFDVIRREPNIADPYYPFYRGVAYLTAWVEISSYSIPQMQCVPQIFHSGLAGKPTNIGLGNANMAQSLYHILTEPEFLYGLTNVSTSSFNTLSDQLVSENLGGAFTINSGTNDIGSVVEMVLAWIGARLRMENGQVTVKLMRDSDSSSATITDADVDPDSVVFTRGSWGEAHATTTLEFSDRGKNYDKNAIDITNAAAREMGAGIKAKKYTFDIACELDIALRVLARLAHQNSFPHGLLKLNTKATGFNLGDLVTVTLVKHRFTAKKFRVTGFRNIGSGWSSIEVVELVPNYLTSLSYQIAGGKNAVTALVTAPVTWGYAESPWRFPFFLVWKEFSTQPQLSGVEFVASYQGVNIASNTYNEFQYVGSLTATLSIDEAYVDEVSEVTSTFVYENPDWGTAADDADWYNGRNILLIRTFQPATNWWTGCEIVYARDVNVVGGVVTFSGLLRGMEGTVKKTSGGGGVNDVYWIRGRDAFQLQTNPGDTKVGLTLTWTMTPIYNRNGIPWRDLNNVSTVNKVYNSWFQKALRIDNLWLANKQWYNTGAKGDAGSHEFRWTRTTKLGGAGGSVAQSEGLGGVVETVGYDVEIRDSGDVLKRTINVTEAPSGYSFVAWFYQSNLRSADGLLSADSYRVRVYAKTGWGRSLNYAFITVRQR